MINRPLILENSWAWATATTIARVRAHPTPSRLARIYRFATVARQFREWCAANLPGMKATTGWLSTQRQQAIWSSRVTSPA